MEVPAPKWGNPPIGNPDSLGNAGRDETRATWAVVEGGWRSDPAAWRSAAPAAATAASSRAFPTAASCAADADGSASEPPLPHSGGAPQLP
jgi:hypothetical protein